MTNASIEKRLQALENDSHPPVTDVPDADDIDRHFRQIYARLERAEKALLAADPHYPHTATCRCRVGLGCNCEFGEFAD